MAEEKKKQTIETKTSIPANILQEWREHAAEMDERIGELDEHEYYDVFSVHLSDGLDRIRFKVSLVKAAADGEELADDAKSGLAFLCDDVDLRLRQIARTIVHEIRRRDAEEGGVDYWAEMKRKEKQKEA